MSMQDAYKPNMKRAGMLFGDAAGTVKKAVVKAETGAKKVVKKLMTPRDSSGYDRVGNQLIKKPKIK